MTVTTKRQLEVTQPDSLAQKRQKQDEQEEGGNHIEDTDEGNLGNSKDTDDGDALKLRIDNFDKYINKKAVEKLLVKNELKFEKVKIIPKSGYATVHCNRAQSIDIIHKLHNYEYKNKKLFISEEKDFSGSNQRVKEAKIMVFDDSTTPSEKIALQTTPLYQVPYEKQLEIKHSDLKFLMKRWKNELLKYFPKKRFNSTKAEKDGEEVASSEFSHATPLQKIKDLAPELRSIVQLNWVKEAMKEYDGLPCELLPVIPSPKIEGYRSKYEFTFGRDLQGEKTCGFLLGLYKEGVHAVLNPIDLLHVSEDGKKIANILQDYVRNQKHDVYDRIKQEGVYRTALVRTLGSGECMIMLQIDPTLLSEEEIEQEKMKFKEFIVGREEVNINSLYIQLSNDAFNGFKDDTPSELLYGTPFVTENILGLSFQISPTSFFQVNPSGTEVLYEKIRDLALKAAEDAKKHVLLGGDYVFVTKEDLNPYLQKDFDEVEGQQANPNPGVVLLDLCCGTGTIGISMAKHVKKVVGVEMVAEAIEDAKKNALANGVENVTYLCGKVEDVMHTVFKEHVQRGDTVVAVLDPPRSGVHSSVIRAIRDCHYLDHVIFVACAFKASMQNFVDLSRPTTNKFRGFPFVPKQAIPVDLFPHTDHCELIVEMEREKADEIDFSLLDK